MIDVDAEKLHAEYWEQRRQYKPSGDTDQGTYDQDPPPNGLSFYSLSAIRGRLNGPQYLIKPFLERETTGIMFGDSGAYKSFVALDMALSVAFGVDFHGRSSHQGPAFYICGEGAGGISRRVEAWLIDRNLSGEDAPFFLSTVPAALIEKSNAQEIADIIRAQTDEPPALIVIDTLSTNIGDGDESSNQDIAKLLTQVNLHLRDGLKSCVLLVHHVGHGDKDRERGAYAIRGNADARIMIERAQGYQCSMHCKKTKDGPEWDPVAFKANVINIPDLTDSEGEPVTSLVMEPIEYTPKAEATTLSNQQEQALAVLVDLHRAARENLESSGYDPEGARVEAQHWGDRLGELKIIKGRTAKANRQARWKIKKALTDAGLIREEGSFLSPRKTDEKQEE